jgi:hypothetical protein
MSNKLEESAVVSSILRDNNKQNQGVNGNLACAQTYGKIFLIDY